VTNLVGPTFFVTFLNIYIQGRRHGGASGGDAPPVAILCPPS
jgi:hypothetical protein